MRITKSLAQIEEAFHEEVDLDRKRRHHLHKHAVRRSSHRELERKRRHGSMRFIFLMFAMVATAVLVTAVMFQTLYIVMG